MKRILFVCTGNTCRSPLAEGLLRQIARQSGLDLEVQSAGTSAAAGMPVSVHSANILLDRELPADGKAKQMDQGLMEWADLVLTMTLGHKAEVIRSFPQSLDKVHTLKEFVLNDPEQQQLLQERQQLLSEIQLKHSLGQAVTDEERRRWFELERLVPGYDISDPFGGSREEYERCAAQIEQCLLQLAQKLLDNGMGKQA